MNALQLKYAIKTMQHAIKTQSAHIFFRTDSAAAPKSYREVVRAFEGGCGTSAERPYLVSADGCENTLYTLLRVNHAFRAWHDQTHYRLGLGFNVHDEILVGIYQAKRVSSTYGQFLMFADTAGQRIAYEVWGGYVENQRAFDIALTQKIANVAAVEGQYDIWTIAQSVAWRFVHQHSADEFKVGE